MELGLLASVPLAHALGIASALLLVFSLVALLILRKTAASGAHKVAGKPAAIAANNGSVKVQQKVDTRERCTILYGTQTGTAERFAKSLRAQLDGKYGSHTAFDLVDVENYNYEEQLPKEKLTLFLMATYGDGEPTDSATGFMEWLTNCAQTDEAADRFKVRRRSSCGGVLW
jgi:NADPH-ferrihemoprotein reductase